MNEFLTNLLILLSIVVTVFAALAVVVIPIYLWIEKGECELAVGLVVIEIVLVALAITIFSDPQTAEEKNREYKEKLQECYAEHPWETINRHLDFCIDTVEHP